MNVLVSEHISRSIYEQGRSFYKAAQQLYETDPNSIPSIVCVAFSVELFIKSLRAEKRFKSRHVYSEGVVSYDDLFDTTLLKPTHDLSKLFDMLDDPIKDDIRNSYRKKYRFYPNIDDCIKNNKDVFLHFRYAFEHHTYVLHKTELYRLAQFFYDYIGDKLQCESANQSLKPIAAPGAAPA